ncbi:unnamed protein product, partial [Rotaria sp. Silwood1]
MEWLIIRGNKDHALRIYFFLTSRKYYATSDTCKRLATADFPDKWPDNVY